MHINTIAVFGTFDILHEGHLNFFRQAKAQSPNAKLVVVVARDVNVIKAKGKPKNDEQTRLENVKKVDIVDEAVLGGVEDKLLIIETLKPDILCLGYDQEAPENLGEILNQRGIKAKIVRLKPYKEDIYKSSKL